MNNLPSRCQPASFEHLLNYRVPVQVAPWDRTKGTVPYEVSSTTSSTLSNKRMHDYWQYDQVSVSEPTLI